MERCDTIVVGAGIVGLATARALVADGQAVIVIETESAIARHQTGHNSGVIHSGLYYKPGSMKARMARAGAADLYALCAERDIAHERCGKLVVAVEESEIPALDELERRGRANGIDGLERLDGPAIREREPHVAGVAGLWVPTTGIVDFVGVAGAFADDVRTGGEVRTSVQFRRAAADDGDFIVESYRGTLACGALVNCAGLQSDRVARLCGVEPPLRIIPFRGEYRDLIPERRGLVNGLVYPVPDARFPFLGVHVTRHIDGSVSAGPNAVLAWRREGYTRWSFRARDAFHTLTWPGFWRLARKYGGRGAAEWTRARSPRAFTRAARRLIPDLRPGDLIPGGSGVRAQAVERDGTLVDDFRVLEMPGQVHVLNAPSPAATASIAIARSIADRVKNTLP